MANKLKWNVLVFPCGTENGLEIWRALRHCKEVKLHGASSQGSNQGSYVYEYMHIIPPVTDVGWDKTLNDIILQNKIDYIFPANDLVIDALVEIRNKLECEVILPNNEIVKTVRSKTATNNALCGIVPIPETFTASQDVHKFPVFVKPDRMYGSQGIQLIESASALSQALNKDPHLVIQEYLPGKEISVDCFTDRHGKLIFSSARERIRVRMGTSMNARPLKGRDQEIMQEYAHKISSELSLRGPWFFQMKQDLGGNWKLLEVDVRIAGTMALNRIRGINFPLLALWDAEGVDVAPLAQSYEVEIDRCLLNRYKHNIVYDAVYIDLDDTIVVHNKLNIEAISFLYQCVNQDKKIVLITKSLETDLKSYLQKWRILNLFDDIIHLAEDEYKADHIKHKDSIFIDDSFSERKHVQETLNIPTFDPSMIETLINERV